MLKISKELFVKTINGIIEGGERIREASAALDIMIDGWHPITLGDEYIDALLELLADTVGDKDCDIISWWLYESESKKRYLAPKSQYNPTDKEIVVDVGTPELLYEYFEKYPE